MINWSNIIANAFWILALALALATLSLARWEAAMSKEKLSRRLQHYQVTLDFAGVMFCIGLAATSDMAWESLLWGVLTFLFVVDIVQIKRGKRIEKHGQQNGDNKRGF